MRQPTAVYRLLNSTPFFQNWLAACSSLHEAWKSNSMSHYHYVCRSCIYAGWSTCWLWKPKLFYNTHTRIRNNYVSAAFLCSPVGLYDSSGVGVIFDPHAYAARQFTRWNLYNNYIIACLVGDALRVVLLHWGVQRTIAMTNSIYFRGSCPGYALLVWPHTAQLDHQLKSFTAQYNFVCARGLYTG